MSTVRLPNIALTGKAGSGKSTVAGLLVEHYNYELVSFARPLKIMAGDGASRERLQQLGADVRALEPQAWIRLALAEIDRLTDELVFDHERPHFVIDDMRYLNEYRTLKGEGFMAIRVRADRGTRLDRLRRNGKLDDEAELEHISETELDDRPMDGAVINHENTSEAALLEQIAFLLNRGQR